MKYLALLILSIASTAFGLELTNPITADGTYTVKTHPGQRYVFSAAGDFGSGSLAIQWNDGTTATAFSQSPATAAETWTFTAPTNQVDLVLSGATDPSITVGITIASGTLSNDAIIGAITEDPEAVQASLGASPAVWVTFADGTRTPYAPSADTNAARGDALDAAWTAALATSGAETIDLYPATFDCARATSTVISVATQFAMEAGMTLRLNGATITHGSSFNGAVIFGADAVDGWSIIGPGVIQGTAATSSGTNEVGINTRTSRRWLIRDLTVRYFRNTGIQANSSSYTSGDYSTGKVSTGKIIGCNLDLNNIGFANYAGSEYISLIGCTLNKNLTAADIYAGNTRFIGCEATYNTNYALRIRDGGNDGHGIWNGGCINHNAGFAVAVEANMDNGFTFTGAHLYADSATSNKIQSLGGGLTFVGCIIDSPFYASATPSGINSVIGSHFPISGVGAVNAVADLSAAERLKWVFESNYSLTGGYANNDDMIYSFADDTAAGTGGLTAGRKYRNSSTNAVAVKQ